MADLQSAALATWLQRRKVVLVRVARTDRGRAIEIQVGTTNQPVHQCETGSIGELTKLSVTVKWSGEARQAVRIDRKLSNIIGGCVS
jgi:hypothetical protein